MDIPVLDFADFTHGSQVQRDDFCRRLYAALSSLGFVKIRNHTIPDETLDRVFDWSKEFFGLPLEDKMQAAHPVQANPHRGWSCVGQEKLSVIRQGKAVFDLKESFDQGPATDTMYPNIFPPDSILPSFRLFMESFYEECQALHLSLLKAVALSLSLEESFLVSRCGVNSSELRLNHYPAAKCADLQDGSMMRISSHSDFGTITLLFQDGVGGLEIESQDEAGVYIPVLPSGSSSISTGGSAGREMILNVGDCLQRWTNDRLRSANHRVTLPVGLKDAKGEGATVPNRYSIAYFGKPSREVSVAAIPELVEVGEEVKYTGAMTAWEYNQSRLLQTY
ncbi:isopenicillin N synthase family dioxygenase [Aspergillus lucknowensis]|uniref:Fe2OG dioxygenase domain-containing protein n=1 Tax=Aspergillus lucknowensis TaxID=176173 RepID=A0ABR4M1F0_9EURO